MYFLVIEDFMLRYLRPNSSSAEMKCTKREQLATKSGRHDQGDQEEHDCITLEARRQLDRQYVHLHFPIKRRLGARLHEDAAHAASSEDQTAKYQSITAQSCQTVWKSKQLDLL